MKVHAAPHPASIWCQQCSGFLPLDSIIVTMVFHCFANIFSPFVSHLFIQHLLDSRNFNEVQLVFSFMDHVFSYVSKKVMAKRKIT